jgi:integrase
MWTQPVSGSRPALPGRAARAFARPRLVGEGFQAMIAVMVFANLRIGEVLGLRWQDIDFDQGYLNVRNQLSPKRELAQLKTKAARRDVVLGAPLGKLLRAHKLASRFSGDVDFVFPAPDGRGRDQRSSSRGIERALERAKLGGQDSPPMPSGIPSPHC